MNSGIDAHTIVAELDTATKADG